MNVFIRLKKLFAKECSYSRLLFLLLSITVIVLPFIIRLHLLDRDEHSLDFIALPFEMGNWDMYYYYKSVFIIFVSYFILWCMILKEKKELVRYAIICVIGFMFLIIASSILSDYKGYTIMGGAKSFQGVFVWMSYLFLCMAGMQLDKKQYYEKLTIVLVFSASILSLIGLLQFNGIDITRFFQNLILHSGYTYVENQVFHSIHSLSFNTNYYGIYLSMVLILNSCVFLYLEKKRFKIYALISYALIFANLVGCKSRAGNYAFILAMILLLIIIVNNKNIKLVKGFISLVIVSTCVFLSMNFSRNSIGTKLSNIETNSVHSELEEIIVKDSILSIITYQGNNLYIKVNKEGYLDFSDEINFNALLDLKINGDTVTIKDQNKEDYKFIANNKRNGINYIKFAYKDNFEFPLIAHHKERTFKTFDEKGALIDIVCPEKSVFFNKRHRFATKRGMIWSLSLPILKRTILTGYGADTFPLVYPNDDFFSRIKTGLYFTTIHSHSLFFQIGIEFGVIALIIFLIFTGIYVCQSLKLYWSSDLNDFYHFLGLGCFLAVCTFLFTGIFNSSMISVSPYFWILFGMGIGINKINSRSLE